MFIVRTGWSYLEIIEPRTDGCLNTAPDASLRQSLRLLVAYPVSAATFG